MTRNLAGAVGHNGEATGWIVYERTTGYRLINSERWLAGLVLDRYDTTLVLKIYTAAWLPRVEKYPRIQERLAGKGGATGRNILSVKEYVGYRGWSGFDRRQVGSLSYVSKADCGLKRMCCVAKDGVLPRSTGESALVESLAWGDGIEHIQFSGRFRFTPRGRARVVTDLDISAHALAAAERNFKLNQTEPAVARALHELVRADAFEWLAGNSRRKFDLVVLDPPSLAKREAERAGAIRAYGKLAESGLKHLLPGGVLVACSCSAHVTAEEFFSAVRQSTAKSGRKFVELRTTRHAPDHPATFAEAEYLKAIYLQLS